MINMGLQLTLTVVKTTVEIHKRRLWKESEDFNGYIATIVLIAYIRPPVQFSAYGRKKVFVQSLNQVNMEPGFPHNQLVIRCYNGRLRIKTNQSLMVAAINPDTYQAVVRNNDGADG